MGYARNQPSVEVHVGRHERHQQRQQHSTEEQEVMSAASVLMDLSAEQPESAPATETLTEYCARIESRVTELELIVQNQKELLKSVNTQSSSSQRMNHAFNSHFLTGSSVISTSLTKNLISDAFVQDSRVSEVVFHCLLQ